MEGSLQRWNNLHSSAVLSFMIDSQYYKVKLYIYFIGCNAVQGKDIITCTWWSKLLINDLIDLISRFSILKKKNKIHIYMKLAL